MINVVILWAIIANSDISYGTRDVSQRELEFLSHHLKDHQCRQLIEALHWPKFKLSRIPDGSHTPTSQSCIQMLEQWNAKESQGQSFVRLVERLRELQLDHLALKVSRAVFKVKTIFLPPKSRNLLINIKVCLFRKNCGVWNDFGFSSCFQCKKLLFYRSRNVWKNHKSVCKIDKSLLWIFDVRLVSLN